MQADTYQLVVHTGWSIGYLYTHVVVGKSVKGLAGFGMFEQHGGFAAYMTGIEDFGLTVAQLQQ